MGPLLEHGYPELDSTAPSTVLWKLLHEFTTLLEGTANACSLWDRLPLGERSAVASGQRGGHRCRPELNGLNGSPNGCEGSS